MNPWIDVGFRNYFPAARFMAILNYKSKSTKRLLDEAKDVNGYIINATAGKACQSVIVLDGTSGPVLVKSALPRIRIWKRLTTNAAPLEPKPKRKRAPKTLTHVEIQDPGTDGETTIDTPDY